MDDNGWLLGRQAVVVKVKGNTAVLDLGTGNNVTVGVTNLVRTGNGQ